MSENPGKDCECGCGGQMVQDMVAKKYGDSCCKCEKCGEQCCDCNYALGEESE